MADRAYIDSSFTLIKKEVRLYFAVSVGESGAVTLQKWNYPVFGMGTAAQTYTAAATGSVTSTTGNYPNRYQYGAEGVMSVTRTAAGLWTIRLQDNYQRMLGLYGYATLAGGLSNIVTVAENSTISSMNAAGGSLIGLALLDTTAQAADPTSGIRMNIGLHLSNATES